MVLAEDLRQAVIQQAIQGKLTKQLETDRSVDDYLEQISNKKAALIKNKEIKKESALTGDMNEDMPLQIPDNWRWEKLGNLCSKIGAGSTPKGGAVNYVAEGVPFIREQNVYSSGLWYSGMVYITEEMNELKAGSMVKPNDLLLNITGGSIGRCALIPNDFIIGNVNQHVLIIRLVDVAIVKYIHVIINSPYIQSQIHEKSKGDKEGLSATSTKNFWIPIPPIEEQQRIVDKINEIMPKIDEYETIEKELETLKKEFPINMKDALLQAAMQGKLTEQLESDSSVDELLEAIRKEKEQLLKDKKVYKDKKLVEDIENKFDIDIPDNWRNIHLQEICTQITDGEHKTPNRVLEYQGYYLLSARNILNGKLVLDDVDYVSKKEYNMISKRCNPHRNDILISCSGSVGRCCLISDDNCYVMVRSAAMIHCLRMNSKYIMYAIQSPYIQAQIDELKKQSVQANLFQSAIASLLVPIPPIEEQQRIVDKLEALLPLCEDLKEM